MNYKVVVVSAATFVGTNFEAAAEELTKEVEILLAEGWQLQGGVAVGETQTTKAPYLFQALVKT